MQSGGGILWIVIIMVLSDAAGTDGRVVAAHVPACPAPHMSPSHRWGTVGRDADSGAGHMATLFVQNIAHSLPTCLSRKIFLSEAL